MENLELLNNYKKSLMQKYNAVCFDIDGTLTLKSSKKIDYRAIELIADLLKRKVPIVFVTGRGETGLIDLKTDIYETLKKEFKITNNEFSRMYILTNDGARLFYTLKEDNDIFKNDIYITTKKELEELKTFNDIISSYLNNRLQNNSYQITYSKDLNKGTIINIRIVFEKENEYIDNVINTIKKTINKEKLNSLHVTRGIYKDKAVIQIGTSKKDAAISKTEKIIGVPEKSMLRIGDCGDTKGNDYSMLNCEQGYSVDKRNNSNDTCFPVIDEFGNILKGIDATIYLIKIAKILPTVCLESADKKIYAYNYAKIERNMILGRNKHLKNFNEMINNNFNLIGGIYDVFDKYSGGIKIPMYEWELTKENPLKMFWSKSNNDKLHYSIRDDNNYILRGSSTYYYILSNRYSFEGKDYTSNIDVINWYKNYLLFLKEAYKAVNETNDINDIINKKMILGLLDNIRNIILVIINHKLYSKYLNDNILLNINSDNNSEFKNLYKIILLVEKIMVDLCFLRNYKIHKEDLFNILSMSYTETLDDFMQLKNNMNDKDYSKEYRAYREIDNFAENYIALYLNQEKNNQIDNFGVCGLSYGGVELPILYKIINKDINDILILKFNSQVSGYTNKQLIDLRKFNINKYGGLKGIEKIKNKKIVVLDDNILTGKSIQLVINSLYDYNLDVKNICVVKYPGTNRIDQMFMNKHGAVDYNLFFDYITGLCFHSPYSWRDENKNKYEDSLGVFDLNRKKIVECLIKNHDYSEKSEIAEHKRRIKK